MEKGAGSAAAYEEYERRRAENIIWNAAGRYDFRPGYEAFDENGRADLYFNTVIGAAYRHYDFDKLDRLFQSLRWEPDGEFYENLLWLGLENGVYEKERPVRPVFQELRRAYAARAEEQAGAAPDQDLFETLRTAHFRRALGKEGKESRRESRLLDALEFDGEMDTDAVIERMRRLLLEFFWTSPGYEEEGKKKVRRRLPRFPGRKKFSVRLSLRRVRPMEADEGNPVRNGDGKAGEGASALQMLFHRELREAQVKAFVEDCFGKSIYSPETVREIENRLCTGTHRGCFLHFTRGELPGAQAADRAAQVQREQVLRQRKKNRAYYMEHLAENRMSIGRLTAKLKNSMLLYMEYDQIRGRSGSLQSDRAWRLECLSDGRVFIRNEQDEIGNLTVDILLDASASQKECQEQVAAQAYIIAESLTRCGIPVKVYAFSSVSGCTVLHLFRDYGEPEKNEAVFDYTAAGWNRDGLALRAAGDWIAAEAKRGGRTGGAAYRLLIVLSDASPCDDQRIAPEKGGFGYRGYEGERAVQDACGEAGRIRRMGVRVMCVFTGTGRDLPAARKIYGNEVVQIRSADRFADRVGEMILSQIGSL